MVAKPEDRISGIVVQKSPGSLGLDCLVGRGVEKKDPKRLSLKPESPLEFVTLAEEGREYSSAPSLMLLRLPLRSS